MNDENERDNKENMWRINEHTKHIVNDYEYEQYVTQGYEENID